MIKTAVDVVGAGRMGMLRIQAMMNHKHCELKYIVTAKKQMSFIQKMYPNVVVDCQMDEMLKDDTVKGVWIASPTDTHFNCIAQIANAKKHIGVEKPVADKFDEIRKGYEMAEKEKVQLLCSFQRQFDPSYEKLKRQVTSIGTIQSIHCVFRDHPMPAIEFLKNGGDPFHDLAVHDIEYVCSLVKDYPVKVMASGCSFIPELKKVNVMDKANVVLYFQNGLVCTMDISRGASYGYDQRIEVFGEKGMLQVLNQPSTSLVSSTNTGISHDVYLHSFPERFIHAYAAEVDHFMDILLNNALPKVTKQQAMMATMIAQAAKESADTAKPVHLTYNGTNPTNVTF